MPTAFLTRDNLNELEINDYLKGLSQYETLLTLSLLATYPKQHLFPDLIKKVIKKVKASYQKQLSDELIKQLQRADNNAEEPHTSIYQEDKKSYDFKGLQQKIKLSKGHCQAFWVETAFALIGQTEVDDLVLNQQQNRRVTEALSTYTFYGIDQTPQLWSIILQLTGNSPTLVRAPEDLDGDTKPIDIESEIKSLRSYLDYIEVALLPPTHPDRQDLNLLSRDVSEQYLSIDRKRLQGVDVGLFINAFRTLIDELDELQHWLQQEKFSYHCYYRYLFKSYRIFKTFSKAVDSCKLPTPLNEQLQQNIHGFRHRLEHLTEIRINHAWSEVVQKGKRSDLAKQLPQLFDQFEKHSKTKIFKQLSSVKQFRQCANLFKSSTTAKS